ncbi:MAG: hypothetical protein JSR83_00470 [Proteobacteria bacterium]|nr:hypothetical protein [Pseudomonadota bacterium]
MALDGERVRKRESDVSRPRKWDQYKKGTKVPQDKPGARNFIEQAEAHYPGTAVWFRSPIWRLLKRESLDRRAIEAEMRALSPQVRALLFEAELRGEEKEPRFKTFEEAEERALLAMCNFEALVAMSLLVAQAEEIASRELHERGLQLYLNLQAGLMETRELAPFYPELFTFIDQRFKHWVYLAPNQRMDVVIFWQGVQAERERWLRESEMSESKSAPQNSNMPLDDADPSIRQDDGS